MRIAPRWALTLAMFGLPACVSLSEVEQGDDAFSSNQATLLNFEFDGEVVSEYSWNAEQTIQSQLLYTVGQLNGNRSVGRLDDVQLSNIESTKVDGRSRIRYHAELPVAWGSKTSLPKSYTFKLPREVSATAQDEFFAAYGARCSKSDAHDVDTATFWYYYRPDAPNCRIKRDDAVSTTAKVSRSTSNTTGKYPEFHRVWEDDRLEVIAIFGKNELDGGAHDVGILGFNRFVRTMRSAISGYSPTVAPENVSDAPGPDVRDVSLSGTLPDGKMVKVTALLVDSITSPWDGFAARYESLTPTADLIVYNGHAGLWQNVRALARMGRWVPKKYQIFFMNGCDTFAYVDGSLANVRAELNPDDPSGTKYMEFVTNAMPSFFESMPLDSASLVGGLLDYERPRTYDQIFERIDRRGVILVTGEEDNEFQPGMPTGSK